MPIDPRRRQKKLERRKAKQKTERRELARRESGGLAARPAHAVTAPILHCCTTAGIWDVGMGEVLVSRQLAGGQVAVVVFLVDMVLLWRQERHRTGPSAAALPTRPLRQAGPPRDADRVAAPVRPASWSKRR